MPPQTQRPSRSAQRLDEYQRFQAGQQTQQGQMMQQLATMFGMSQQQVAAEIARANLEIAQGRLGLDKASQPSEIRNRDALAKINELTAGGFAASEKSRLESQGAGTAETQARTKGISTANEMAQRTSANQPTVIERENRAGEQGIARDAASTRNLNSTALAQEYENLFGEQNAKTRADSLGKQNIGFGLQNDLTGLNIDRYKWENGANMLTRELEDAAKVAATEQAIAGKGLTEQQTLALQKSLPYITRNADEALRISGLQGGLIQANIDRSNGLLASDVEKNMIELANLPAQYAGQNALTAAQAQNIRATSAFGAFDRNLVNGMQGAELAIDPTYYNANIRPVHERVAAERGAVRAKDEAYGKNFPLDTQGVPLEFQASPKIAQMLEQERQKQAAAAAFEAAGPERIATQQLYQRLHPFKSMFDIPGNMQLEKDYAAQKKKNPNYTGL